MLKENMINSGGRTNKITWIINEKCNFQCSYCGYWRNNRQPSEPIDIQKLSEGLNCLRGVWHFNILGGEPFLEKNFIDICREITKKNYVSLITNLSTANVFDFADNINPEKCGFINASIHITEREKRDVNLSSFIEKVLYLQEKGFNIRAQYVTFPDLFDRIKSDFEFLKSSGIQKVYIKVFSGEFNGKHYPSSFTTDEKKFLENLGADYHESEILNKSHEYYGKLCLAGQRSFVMDRDGNLKRCFSVLKSHGNFFEKSIRYDTKTKPCPKNNCDCPYEAIDFVLPSKGNIFSIWKEDYNEKLLISKINGNNSTRFHILMGMLWNKARKPFRNIKKIKKIFSAKYIGNKFWQLIGALEKRGIPLHKIKILLKNLKLIK